MFQRQMFKSTFCPWLRFLGGLFFFLTEPVVKQMTLEKGQNATGTTAETKQRMC